MHFTSKKTCEIMGRDRKTQADDFATGHCGHVPNGNGNLRLWSQDDMACELYFMDLRAEHYTVRIAGGLAGRLRRGIEAAPDAERIALVTLTNGSRFALPADKIDLTSGYSSGAPVREAIIIDVRNLRSRIADMIEVARQIVGVLGEE